MNALEAKVVFDKIYAAADLLEIEAKALEESAAATVGRATELRERAVQMRGSAYELDPAAREEARLRACTGKRAYKTPSAAGDAAKAINRKRDVDLRIYPCEFCRMFHFTSSSLEDFISRKAA